MAPSDFRPARLLARRSGRYPAGPHFFSCLSFPVRWSLPRVRGGSASTTSFSRPARHLHVTACQIARPPSAAFVTRHRPGSCPPTVARQLPSPIDFGSCGLLLPLGLRSFQDTPQPTNTVRPLVAF